MESFVGSFCEDATSSPLQDNTQNNQHTVSSGDLSSLYLAFFVVGFSWRSSSTQPLSEFLL